MQFIYYYNNNGNLFKIKYFNFMLWLKNKTPLKYNYSN